MSRDANKASQSAVYYLADLRKGTGAAGRAGPHTCAGAALAQRHPLEVHKPPEAARTHGTHYTTDVCAHSQKCAPMAKHLVLQVKLRRALPPRCAPR